MREDQLRAYAEKMAEASTACAVPGCDRPQYARGFCSPHYRRWQTTGDVRADEPLRVAKYGKKKCPLCKQYRVYAKGVCKRCYDKLRNRGWRERLDAG